MKNWLKEYKWNIVWSMALTLLPMLIGLLLWNRLPDEMTSHWGADGVADGTASKAFMVFGVPAMLAGLNILCILATALDKKQAAQNKKAMRIVFWIMPIISTAVMCSAYAIAMGKAMDVFVVMPLLLGVMFVAMGNYMPKIKQNSTLGNKISWTLHNEENWNKTHRFAGKLWVAGGVITMLSALLPAKWMLPVIITAMLVVAVAPMVYSYRIYRRHKAAGIDYAAPAKTKGHKAAKWGSVLGVVAVLAIVMVLMFTGNIAYTVTDSALQIEATYHSDALVTYDQIDAIELRENFNIGYRTMGYGSSKLSMGTFQNDAFGTYTLYSYNSCNSMIVIHSEDKVLAINCKTAEETQTLYESLLAKIGE